MKMKFFLVIVFVVMGIIVCLMVNKVVYCIDVL